MEQLILSHLVHNEKYARAAIPFLKAEYFDDAEQKLVFNLIHKYSLSYNAFPTKEALFIDLENIHDIPEKTFNDAKFLISNLKIEELTDVQWLLDSTEKFCQDKAIYNAIKKSMTILTDKEQNLNKGSIPQLLQDALQVSFDTHIGHDFLDDTDSRYEMYHKKEDRISFDLDLLNYYTGGGLPDKTLNCLVAPTGAGKTLVMCHMAAHNLMCNRNVLYITLEMAEERIAQRIDQNIMAVTAEQLLAMSKLEYDKKINKVRETTKGKLVVKEYPTASAGAAHFRHLLTELKIKKKFVPDIIYIDYINLCISSRIKVGSNVNSYTYVKAIAEELRGLAVEFGLPIMTATQSNRDSISASDFGIENTSESLGLPMTVDLLVGLIVTEQLDELNQMMFKLLKNRYGEPNRRFVVGLDRPRMRLYNVEDSAQEELLDGPGPVMDRGAIMEREDENKKFNKDKYKGFK